MKNNNIIKEVLTKMFYDTSKTLSENIESNKNIISEAPKTVDCYAKSKQLLSQGYLKVDHLAYLNAYNTKNFSRTYFWCPKDKKNWEYVKTLDTSKPNTTQKVKNFQKWYLEFKEKAKPEAPSGLYRTKLCASPCKYADAVDGDFGDRTKSLWSSYGSEYKAYNPNFNVNTTFDWGTTQNNYKLKQYPELAKIFRFTVINPSGWNYQDVLPKAITEKTPTYAKFKSSECPFYKGWDLLNQYFPTPKKYTTSQLNELEYTIVDQDALTNLENEKKLADQELEYKIKGSGVSDRLGYAQYRPDPYGVGPTKAETEYKANEESYQKKKNEILGFMKGAQDWNKDLDKVNSSLSEKCGRPLMFCDTTRKNQEGKQINDNCIFISYSDICRRAGGLWVYDAGTNNAWCGCRSMTSPGISDKGGTMIQFQGPKGSFTSTIDWTRSLEYQTPGSGTGDREQREKDHHNLMMAELLLTGLGFVSGPFGPLFFGAATIVGFADSAKYLKEGDYNMGILTLSLTLIGVPELVNAFKLARAEIKAIAIVEKYGADGVRRLVKASVETPQLLGAAEKAEIAILKQAAATSSRILGKETFKEIGANIGRNLAKTAKENKWGWKDLAKIVWNFSTKEPTFKGVLIYLGGVPYTIDQIYLALYGNDLDRQRSGVANLYDYITGHKRELEISLNRAWIDVQANLQKEGNKISDEDLMTFFESILTPDGKIDTSKLESDEEVLDRLRKQGKIPQPVDKKGTSNTVKPEVDPEIEKINCDEIQSLIKLGYKELNKIDFLKEKQKNIKDPNYPSENCKNNNGKCFQNIVCGGVTRFFVYQPPTINYDTPYINKSIVSNTNDI